MTAEHKEFNTRRNRLRLPGFDYSSRRVYFVTIATLRRRKFFLDRRLASATMKCLFELREKRSSRDSGRDKPCPYKLALTFICIVLLAQTTTAQLPNAPPVNVGISAEH